MHLQGHVNRALDCATSQGYSFAGWSVEDIVLDLLAYDDDVQGHTEEQLTPYVADWCSRHPEAIAND